MKKKNYNMIFNELVKKIVSLIDELMFIVTSRYNYWNFHWNNGRCTG